MNRFKVTFQSVIIRLGVITVCSLFLPATGSAAGPAGFSSDITPPRITIVAPRKDSQTDTGAPRIEVSFSDILSGINPDTIHLFVDRMEVTAKAVIEQEDVTGQAPGSPWRITYSPEPALSRGKHEIRFSVQDLAGNLAEFSWSFEVMVGEGGLRIGGSNSLRVDRSPVKMITDALTLTAQGQYRQTDVRLNATGKITDYPGTDPDYDYEDYNFYYDDYSLGFYHRQASAVFGYVNASLDSELLQIGLQMYGNGGVVSNTADGAGGQYHWTVFSGDSGSSYGTGSDVYRMSGLGGDWRAGSGLTLGGYYVDLGGDEGYNFTGIRGNIFLGGLGLLRFEAIRGLSETDERSGNGWALHLDKSLAGCDLGLDYTLSEPEYPDIGSFPLFTSTDRGLQTYGLRAFTAINQFHSFSFDSYFSRDNLDHSQTATETRRNISVGYNYRPDSGFSLNANYQGDFKNKAANSEQDNVFILGVQQKIGVSQLKVTCTLDAARAPAPGDTYDQINLLSSWTCPAGAYNLTPSLLWSNQKSEDGSYSKSVEVRLTLDRKLYSDLPRSSVAFFYRVSDELDDDEQTRVTSYGVLPYLYFKTGPNSILTLVYDYSDWTREMSEDTEGVDTVISLTWKVEF